MGNWTENMKVSKLLQSVRENTFSYRDCAIYELGGICTHWHNNLMNDLKFYTVPKKGAYLIFTQKRVYMREEGSVFYTNSGVLVYKLKKCEEANWDFRYIYYHLLFHNYNFNEWKNENIDEIPISEQKLIANRVFWVMDNQETAGCLAGSLNAQLSENSYSEERRTELRDLVEKLEKFWMHDVENDAKQVFYSRE